MKILVVAGFESAAHVWNRLPLATIQELGKRAFRDTCEVATRLEAEQYPPDGLIIELRSDTPVKASSMRQFIDDLHRQWDILVEQFTIPDPHNHMEIVFYGVLWTVEEEENMIAEMLGVIADAVGIVPPPIGFIHISLN